METAEQFGQTAVQFGESAGQTAHDLGEILLFFLQKNAWQFGRKSTTWTLGTQKNSAQCCSLWAPFRNCILVEGLLEKMNAFLQLGKA